MHNVAGLLFLFVLFLAFAYVYNSFIAKPGQSLATLGAKSAA